MTSIDVFYQGEGVRDVEHIEVGADHTFAVLKARLIEKHGLAADVYVFLEDSDDPIDEVLVVGEYVGPAGLKAHVHHCRHVEVAVTFNNETVHYRFGPGTTAARVKHWAAVDKFKMTEAEAGEHVLQIAGTHDRPAPGTHLGALVACPNCRIEFYLVPDQRVNGNEAGEER
jgi:hypothetical protein